MTVYVDPIMDHGWILRGKPTKNCHLFTDSLDQEELHQLAEKVGMQRRWFQNKSIPHYDLNEKKRALAIEAGAVEVDRRTAVEIWRRRRARVAVFQ